MLAAACAALLAVTGCGNERPSAKAAEETTSSAAPTPSSTSPPTATTSAAVAATPHPTTTPAQTRTPAPTATPSRSASPTSTARATRPVTPMSTATPSPTPGAGQVWLPAHGSDTTPRAAIEATVVGDAEQRCVWLRATDGTRHAVLWPSGYRARFGPVRIYDERDRLVWQESDAVRTVGGGFSTVHVERIPKACRTGDDAWWMAPLSG